MLVYERAVGRCERCGLPAGRIAPRGEVWRVAGAHVHHVVPKAVGGGHGLANLQLRCRECHRLEHPGNPALR